MQFLDRSLSRMIEYIATISGDAADAYSHARDISRGGRHIRSRLVHIAADRPHGECFDEDIAVAAAFDLLHCAFLVIDDVIDGDDQRRGVVTIHAAARTRASLVHGEGDETVAEHYGRSVAILAGITLINEATRIISSSGADPETALYVLQIFHDATSASAIGEFMDIHHSLPAVDPSHEDIQLAYRLKTSEYSFTGPLLAGALLAKRSEALGPLRELGTILGAAFQIANDVRDLGEDGDLLNQRATTLLLHASTTPQWEAIAEAIELGDVATAADLLHSCGSVQAARDDIARHLAKAHTLIDNLDYSDDAKDALHDIADAVAKDGS